MLKIFKVTFLVLLVSFLSWGVLYYKAQDAVHPTREVGFFRKPFEMIAYRGGGLEAPENTISAFQNATQANHDVILHLNVQMTADKKVVVFYDENLARTTDGTGPIWRQTTEDLQKLNAAYKFKNEKGENPFSQEKIPLLQDVLSKFPNQRFIIELGQQHKELAFLVYEIVKDQSAFERVLISSDNNQPLKYLRDMDPRFFFTASQDEVARLTMLLDLKLIGLDPMRADAYFVPTKMNSIPIVSDELISEIHKRGKNIFVKIINDIASAESLRARNVGGIATERPQALATFFKN